jgi:RNA polymerase sigma-70 factor (ECF subfamily)
VLTLARDYFPNPEDAEDAVQEVYIKLATAGSRAPDGDADAGGWVYRVAENTLKDLKRKARLRNRADIRDVLHYDDVVDNDDPLTLLLRQEAGSMFLSNYGNLPPKLRTVFIARYQDGLSYEQIAKKYNIAIGTVASRMTRARELCQV